MPTYTSEQMMADLADLRALHAFFMDEKENFQQNIEDARNAQAQVFYVDQVAGEDTAAGSVDNPIQSLSEAASRAVDGGYTRIFLQSDYLLSEDITFPNSTVHLRSHGARRTLSFSAEIDGVTPWSPRLQLPLEGGRLFIMDLAIQARQFSAHVTERHVIRTTGATIVVLRDVDLQAGPGDQLALLSGYHVYSLTMTLSTRSEDFQLIQGIAPGTDPSTVSALMGTNLTEL